MGLYYVVVGLLRIQNITSYIVLVITMYVELQYTLPQISRMLLLLYYLDLDFKTNRYVFQIVHTLSREVKYWLRILLSFKNNFEQTCPTRLFTLQLYVTFLLLQVFVMMWVNRLLCIFHPLREIFCFACEILNLCWSLKTVGSKLVYYFVFLVLPSYLWCFACELFNLC